jgi:protein O-mannosyl-transferase
LKLLRGDFPIYVMLAAATLAVYAQAARFGFVNYDDPDYVTHNFQVRAGLTGKGVEWAFGAHASNWIPLTWLSHMADCQLFGMRSGMHHLVSVIIHLASVLLLFAVLKRMTKAVWLSAFVALVFGVHPLHVESVAWISERKDVLCAFFWILTLWNYTRYVELPRRGRYLIVLLTFSLGLLAKQMIVTLPFALLLLDFWPLQRNEPWGKTFREKLPLFALSAVASVITLMVQRQGGAVIALQRIPISLRIENAFVSYVTYLRQFLWPAKLAAFYPYPDTLPLWQSLTAILVIAGISFLAWRTRRVYPWIFSGWFWYLGTLVPVIGLVQVGAQSHADRYTYIPLIGFSIVLAWGARTILKPRVAAVTAIVVCSAWIVTASGQAAYWRDSETLFRHAIEVTQGNYVAWSGLGLALKERGQIDEAAADYRKALEIKPDFPDARNNLGEALLLLGHPNEAIIDLKEAIRLQPSADAHTNMGAALERLGKLPDAHAEYLAALSLDSRDAAAHTGMGSVLEDEGRKDEALQQLDEAVEIDPDYAPAHYNLGRLLGMAGRTSEAATQFSEAIRLQPQDAASHYNLGTALAIEGKLDNAAGEFRKAIALNPGDAMAHFNLGSALAQLGKMDEAIAQFAEAVRIRPDFEEARQSLEAAKQLSGSRP